MLPPPWIDGSDVEAQVALRARGLDPEVLRHGLDVIRDGFTIIRNAVAPETCRAVMDDFARYVGEHAEDAARHRDDLGRHFRLINFHLASDVAMAIGMNEKALRVLDFLFGHRSAVYTSLYFEYGTGQPIHRDSPFFHTFPINYFAGVWTALEDIHPDSGPLTYVPGGHRWRVDHQAIFRRVRADNPTQPHDWCVNHALHLYYAEVISRAGQSGAAVTAPLRVGDTAIWHAQLPHGGSPIANKTLTRSSMVFHCTPDDMQVYHQDVFFSHPPSDHPPLRFPYRDRGARKYAESGPPVFGQQY